MKRLFLALSAALVLLAQGCMDAEPAEISVRATIGGQPTPCVVKLFNAKHVQIREDSTDMQGLLYIKPLAPGDYHLEFADRDGNAYPAKKAISLSAGASEIVDVELNEAPTEPTS
jgi:hypothetical protein